MRHEWRMRALVRVAACLVVGAAVLGVAPAGASAAALVGEPGVSHVAISPNADGLADTTVVSVQASDRAWVRASVVRADGTPVRLLWNTEVAAGSTQVEWDGTDDAGARVIDGAYRLTLDAWPLPASATTANGRAQQPLGAAQDHLEQPLAVDTRAPVLTLANAHPQHRAGSRLVELGVRLDEHAMVDVRVQEGKSTRREVLLLALEPGKQRVTVRSSDTLFRTRRAGTYRVGLVASDEAWNTSTQWVTVRVTADPKPPTGSWTGGSDGTALPSWLRPIMVRATSAAGVPTTWADSPALAQLLLHESSFNPTAQNPTSTAFGLFQFLDTTWAGSGGTRTSDPYLQSVYGLRYIKRRYRTPERAWTFWQAQSPHWYAKPSGPTGLRAPLAAAAVVAPAAPRVHAIDLSNDSISPNGDARADEATITTTLTSPSRASVQILDASGAVVRTLWGSDLPIGATELTWDGTRDDGQRAADGTYTVQVLAGLPGVDLTTGAERTTATVRVDTVAPTPLATAAHVKVRGADVIRVPVQLNEEAVVTVRVRDGKATRELAFQQPAGVSDVTIRTPAAWKRARHATKGSVTLEASDPAWNVATVTVPVDVQPAPVTAVQPQWGGGQLLMPVHGVITSPFGTRWGKMHEGLDIAVPIGTPIHAAAAGKVVIAGSVSGYGNVVYLDHGNGLSTRYGHQSRVAVRPGQVVKRGQLIGYSGNTGHSTGPHVHFEVRLNGVARNPVGYL